MQNDSINCQIVSEFAITLTIAIRWKEKYDVVVVYYHHSLRSCGDKVK